MHAYSKASALILFWALRAESCPSIMPTKLILLGVEAVI
jgi:hypothetical protein